MSVELMEDYAVLLFIAGLDTVINGMGFAVRHMALNPALQEELRTHPDRIVDAVEEMLRRYSFAQPMRRVAKETEFAGWKMMPNEWLVLFYAVVTFGELCLSPMALSLVTKLSPKRLVGLTMGGWFLATAFGNNFSGFFGGLSSTWKPTSFFLLLAVISGVVCAVIGLVLPKLDKAIKQYGA